ncbi:Cytochrome c [Planctomycetes bacterium Pan216]|uniref:Cytochrome c n=1 Tax=Kolteria novifilia TaxID=2527975 RepID=A0A518AXU7_9BACT|nr:Cytochrome c [Planctomycetes bacterium Pan216]
MTKPLPTGFLVGMAGTLALFVSFHVSANEREDKRSLYPPGKLGETVRLGEELVKRTQEHPLAKPYVGNSLNCTSCHLEAGTHPRAATFLGTARAYPAWSPREQRVITLEDRVLNCFMRSQNGVRPPKGSRVSVAITTYITWLSSDQPITMNHDKPLGPNHLKLIKQERAAADPKRGATLYRRHCADCHGERGEGLDDAPPVWGPRSYNSGAGLATNHKLASWLKVAMPPGEPLASQRDVLDIAAYVNSKPRPKFVLREHLPASHRLGEYNAEKAE